MRTFNEDHCKKYVVNAVSVAVILYKYIWLTPVAHPGRIVEVGTTVARAVSTFCIVHTLFVAV